MLPQAYVDMDGLASIASPTSQMSLSLVPGGPLEGVVNDDDDLVVPPELVFLLL